MPHGSVGWIQLSIITAFKLLKPHDDVARVEITVRPMGLFMKQLDLSREFEKQHSIQLQLQLPQWLLIPHTKLFGLDITPTAAAHLQQLRSDEVLDQSAQREA